MIGVVFYILVNDVPSQNPSLLQHTYALTFSVVSWKKPSNYNGDDEPSWLIAENLDQWSLAEAFRKFPMDADPDRNSVQESKMKAAEDQAGHFDIEDDFSDDEEEEESDEEDDDIMEKSSDDMQEYDEEDSGKSADVAKDPDVSHLEDSGMLHQVSWKKCCDRTNSSKD